MMDSICRVVGMRGSEAALDVEIEVDYLETFN
jgi:hypothetical protein